MCRWLVWVSGVPVMLEDVVLSPTNSLLVQSFEAGYIPGHVPTHLVDSTASSTQTASASGGTIVSDPEGTLRLHQTQPLNY